MAAVPVTVASPEPDESHLLIGEPAWGVARASVLGRGERRFEAETYLSDGYGLRLAIESRATGWVPLRELTNVWQPSRLKGVVAGSEDGAPFLAAGQVFETRPTARKWLSLSQTPDASERFVQPGTILVSCSGIVGRVALAHRPHIGRLISHDLLRVDAAKADLVGWLYAYLRTASFRLMATGERYGHVIKHLEVAHLDALPVVQINGAEEARFNAEVNRIFSYRDRAYSLIDEAEELYRSGLGIDSSWLEQDLPFSVRSSGIANGRRRLDAFHYNLPSVDFRRACQNNAIRVQTLNELSVDIWWPGRFRRVFGANGTPYVSAEDLFNLNPVITKFVYSGLIENREDYFLEPEWLVMVRSGQVYGLNGSVRLVGQRLTRFLVSEDLIRISPRLDLIRHGYLLAALAHPTLGRPLVIRHAYGTSIPHLEPDDVATIEIPRLESSVEEKIADRYEEASELQASADELEDQITTAAEQIVQAFMRGMSAV